MRAPAGADERLSEILETMLLEGEDITARAAVLRSRGVFRHPSDITRVPARRALLELREEDRIGDEVLRKMLREADLKARAAEGPAAALPGAATMRSATSFWNMRVRLGHQGGHGSADSQRTRSGVATL